MCVASQIYHTEEFLIPRCGVDNPLFKRALWSRGPQCTRPAGGGPPAQTYYQYLRGFVKCVLVVDPEWRSHGSGAGSGVPIHTLVLIKMNAMLAEWARVKPVLEALPTTLVAALRTHEQQEAAARGVLQVNEIRTMLQTALASCETLKALKAELDALREVRNGGGGASQGGGGSDVGGGSGVGGGDGAGARSGQYRARLVGSSGHQVWSAVPDTFTTPKGNSWELWSRYGCYSTPPPMWT